MPTEETAYKSRVAKLMKGTAEKAKLTHIATALGVGAMAGMPDKWFQFGHVMITL